MFLLVSLSKSKFFTRAALVQFVQHSFALVLLVQHSCRTRVARFSLVSLVPHSCCIRVARVWHSRCKLDQIFSKLQFHREENLKKQTTLEEQKCTKYIRGNVYFCIIVFSCLSSTKSCPRFLLVCLDQEIKGFYQISLENEVDFTDILNVSPNILAKN